VWKILWTLTHKRRWTIRLKYWEFLRWSVRHNDTAALRWCKPPQCCVLAAAVSNFVESYYLCRSAVIWTADALERHERVNAFNQVLLACYSQHHSGNQPAVSSTQATFKVFIGRGNRLGNSWKRLLKLLLVVRQIEWQSCSLGLECLSLKAFLWMSCHSNVCSRSRHHTSHLQPCRVIPVRVGFPYNTIGFLQKIIQCESKKSPPSEIFWHFFPNG